MVYLTREDWGRIKDIKQLDLEICSFCSKLNILNLGWKAFGKYWCEKEQKEHVLCPELCLKVCLNILKCELQQKRKKIIDEPIKPNRPYDWANCYGCSKELKSASKKGVIKNRNNPNFWGISSSYKILCLECVGKKFYKRLNSSKKKTFRKYLGRGYD